MHAFVSTEDGADQAPHQFGAAAMSDDALPEEAVPEILDVPIGLTATGTRKESDSLGTVEVPAEDTPYGRLAACADPTGTRFKLIG